MGRLLHGSARTTAASRRTIQHSQESIARLAARYNFAKRLKTLRGLTPYEYISKCWQKEPERFRLNPHHHSMGLNT